MEEVILVDEGDHELGMMEKLEAHRKGVLHRAFSVLLYNKEGKLLLQKRSSKKYHSAGLWTNTCCSHPRPRQNMETEVTRRLKEEMGIVAETRLAFRFVYKAPLENHITEHELDYVYIGRFDGEPMINPEEVEDWKFMPVEEIRADMQRHPDAYTYWFKLIVTNPKFSLPGFE